MEKLSSVENEDQVRYNQRKKAWTGRQLVKLSFAGVILLMIGYLIFKYAMSCASHKNRLNDLEKLKQSVTDSNARMKKASQEIESQTQSTQIQRVEVDSLVEKIAFKEKDIEEFNSDFESIRTQKTNFESKYEELVKEMNRLKKDNEGLGEEFGEKPQQQQETIVNSIFTEEEKREIKSVTGKEISKSCYEINGEQEQLNVELLLARCRDLAPTIVIVKTVEGNVLGGYTTVPWNTSGNKEDSKAFIFSLTTKLRFLVSDNEHAVIIGGNYLSFGDDLIIGNHFCLSKFPFSYGDKYHMQRSDFFGDKRELKIANLLVLTLAK